MSHGEGLPVAAGMVVGITPVGSGLGPPGKALGAPSPSGSTTLLRRHQGPNLQLSNSQKSKHSRKGCAGCGEEERRKVLGPDMDPGSQINRQKSRVEKAPALTDYTSVTQAAY